MYLIVIFLSELTLALSPTEPNHTLLLSDINLYDQNNRDWTGFFDWLRNSTGNVIGVRYCPHDNVDRFLNSIKNLSYVLVEKNNSYLEIYFSPDHNIVQEISGDQDFGYNRVYVSNLGVYAISFGLSSLKEVELKSIENLDVKWVEIVK